MKPAVFVCFQFLIGFSLIDILALISCYTFSSANLIGQQNSDSYQSDVIPLTDPCQLCGTGIAIHYFQLIFLILFFVGQIYHSKTLVRVKKQDRILLWVLIFLSCVLLGWLIAGSVIYSSFGYALKYSRNGIVFLIWTVTQFSTTVFVIPLSLYTVFKN